MGTEGKGWSCCTGTRNMLLVTLAVLDPYYARYPICLIEVHTQYVPHRQTFTGGRERAVWEHWSRGQQRTSKHLKQPFPPLLPAEGVYEDEYDHPHGLGLPLLHAVISQYPCLFSHMQAKQPMVLVFGFFRGDEGRSASPISLRVKQHPLLLTFTVLFDLITT